MSWSGTVTAQFSEAETAIGAIAVSPDSTAPEQIEQVAAAKDAAVALLKSQTIVNDADQDVTITINGHSNPGHKPAAGWANDAVTVTLYQVTRQTSDA